MSVIAAALKHMLAAGMDHAAILDAVADLEATLTAPKDPVADRKRAYDREYRQRHRTTSYDSHDIVAPPAPSLPSPPDPPIPPTHAPRAVYAGAKPSPLAQPNGFARFWEAYPDKTGKRGAEAAYDRAVKRIEGPDPPGVILAGVERAKLSRRWREGYVKNPATWLNQDCWTDEEPDERPDTNRPPSPSDNRRTRAESNFAGAALALERRRSERLDLGQGGDPGRPTGLALVSR